MQTPAHLDPVADEEIGEVASLISRAFRGISWHTEEELVSDFTLTEEQLRNQVSRVRPHGALLQWKEGNKRIACVLLRPVNQEHTKWRFAWLAIEPNLQTSGRGKKMMEAIEHYSEQRGATLMEMNAMNVRKNLIAWYQRRGYILTGDTESFAYKQEQAHRDDLCFVVLQKVLSG
jgi:N-acetylglutamate synthase-like GNAT family acetyltransferase